MPGRCYSSQPSRPLETSSLFGRRGSRHPRNSGRSGYSGYSGILECHARRARSALVSRNASRYSGYLGQQEVPGGPRRIQETSGRFRRPQAPPGNPRGPLPPLLTPVAQAPAPPARPLGMESEMLADPLHTFKFSCWGSVSILVVFFERLEAGKGAGKTARDILTIRAPPLETSPQLGLFGSTRVNPGQSAAHSGYSGQSRPRRLRAAPAGHKKT